METQSVAAALHATPFHSVLGTIGFDEKGDVTGHDSLAWYVWREGDYTPVVPAELAE